MRLFTKNDGAVSVFLVIILVPMLVVTSLFVDVGRMHLGQAMVDSAGELVLNTAMTEFDAKLNDYYGLLGTCKSEEEIKKVSQEFYKESIVSAGLSDEDANDLVSQLMGMFGEDIGEVSDLMNLELVEDSFELKKVANSGFNNPAIVKTQVINFMKYRSPINGVLNLLGGIEELSQQSGNIQEETELIEEKKTMCEKQKSLMELLKELHDEIKKYEELKPNDDIMSDKDGMREIIGKINKFREKFYKCCEEAVINFMYLDFNKIEDFDPKLNKVVRSNQTIPTMTVTSAFIGMNDCILDYQKKRDALEKKCNINTGNALRDGTKKALEVPALYKDYVIVANKMSKTYRNMVAAYAIISNKDDVYPGRFESLGDKELTYRETYQYFKGFYNSYKKDFDGHNPNSPYLKILNNKIEGVGPDNLEKLRDDYKNKKDDLNDKIKALAVQFTNITSAVASAGDHLEKAWNKLEYLLKRDGELDQYNDANKIWREHAERLKEKGSEIGKEDVETFSGPEKNTDGSLTDAGLQKGISKYVTRDNIGNLKNHIKIIRDKLQEIFEKLERMKFGQDPVGAIKTVKKVNEKFTSRISRDTFESNVSNIEALKDIIKDEFDTLYKDESVSLPVNWVGQSESTPNLRSDPLRKWLNEAFDDNRNTERGKEYEEKYEDRSEEEAKKEPEETNVSLEDKYKVSGNSIKALDGSVKLPSSEITQEVNPIVVGDTKQSDDLKKSSDVIGTLFSGIISAVKEFATGLRDDLYAVDYITSMLSYDTYVNEGLYDIAKAKGHKVEKLLDTQASIKKQDVTDTWKVEECTNSANKSLTNKEISRDNNYAFGNEAEYILYGFDSNTKNKASAYGTIFALRLGFNSIYAFKEYWKDGVITSIAAAISAATYGIVPPALIKVAIILALAVAETVHDIAMLKAGMPVAVIKTKDTWAMQFSSVFGGDGNLTNVSGTNKNHGNFDLSLRYSDYIKIFLMISLAAGNENKIYTRLSDVIQCNMAHITKNNAYSLSNCTTWFSVSSTVRVNPLMLDLPWTKDWEGNPKDDTSWYTLSYARSNGYY